MKRKRIYKSAVFFMLVLCGCGGVQEQKTEAPEREELVLWSYYETEAQREGLDKLTAKFNASQWEYKVSWEYVPMSDFVKELTIAVSDSTLPDIVLVDNPDMTGLVNAGFLEDMTEKLGEEVQKEEYYDEVWAAVEFDDRIYGVPFCCNNTAIIYNRQMFEDAGVEPPETWEEFEEAAKALTVKGESGHYGFVMSAAIGEQGAFQFMPWLLATGADRQHLDDKITIEAFELMSRMIAAKSMPNNCLNWSQTDITRLFVDEKTAMMQNGPWALPEIKEAGIDYGICPIPAHNGQGVIIGGETLAVLKGKNVDGAAAFIDFYNQEEVMEEICTMTGNIAPTQTLAGDFCEQNPEYTVFVNQMQYGINRNSIQNWKYVCRVLSDSLYQLFGSNRSTMDIWYKYAREIAGDENSLKK